MKNKLATESLEITNREKTHNEIVRNAAAEGIVLLKNNGVLPFDKSIKTIALYGIGARRTVKGGTGSGDVNVRSYVNVEEGLENAGYEVVTKPYLDEYDRIINEAKTEYAKMLQEKGKEGVKQRFSQCLQILLKSLQFQKSQSGIRNNILPMPQFMSFQETLARAPTGKRKKAIIISPTAKSGI